MKKMIVLTVGALLVAGNIYAGQDLSKVKGIKAFPGEPEKVKTEEAKTANIKSEIAKPAAVKPDKGQALLKEKNKALEAQIKEDEAKSKEEKARLYLELGNAYTKARLYKNAIDSYLASLEANPKNAEAHYNLGLLYQRYQQDTDKAIKHLKKYLNSNPPPNRKKEVKYLLEMLRTGREWVSSYY